MKLATDLHGFTRIKKTKSLTQRAPFGLAQGRLRFKG
jgi:hypothetical protein